MTRTPGEFPANQNFQAAPGPARRLSAVPDRPGSPDQPVAPVDQSSLAWLAHREAHQEKRRARFGLARDTPHQIVVAYEAKERAFEAENRRREAATLLGLAPDAPLEVVHNTETHERQQNRIDSVILPTDPGWRDPREVDWLAAHEYVERARLEKDNSIPADLVYCGRFH